MKTFRKRLDELKAELNTRFWQLREQNPEIIITSVEDFEEGVIDDYFDRRNDINGTVHEIAILKIDKGGIHTRDVHDWRIKKVIGLRDLASIEDVISLIELMEIKYK